MLIIEVSINYSAKTALSHYYQIKEKQIERSRQK